MIPRHATSRLHRLFAQFPVVTVTGPRQSGKTTLVRAALPQLPYVSLETPAEREFARGAPAEFLQRFAKGAVIDEAQHAPELLSQIQTVVDGARRNGLFVLTGSQNLALLANVTQSLAGRTAFVELPPLSVAELREAGRLPRDPWTCIAQGFYPALHGAPVDPREWMNGYLMTYVERDVRQVAAIQDLGAFQRFLRLAAARSGQLLNLQSLAADTGVSDKTVKHWLSVLETCYLVHFARPHLANYGKRLVKMPKLYFTDVGLAASLLGIDGAAQVESHPLRGALFETLVVNELFKARRLAGDREPLHFWRDHIGTEVDVVLERGREIAAVEIKSGLAVAADAFGSLKRWQRYAIERGDGTGAYAGVHMGLVYAGTDRFTREGVDVLPWGML